MSLADLMPVRIGFPSLFDRRVPRTRHRAVDEVERQQALRHGADLLIKGLRLQLEEQEARHAEVVARIDERHAEVVRGLEQQVADLERRLDIRAFAEAAAAKTQELDVRSLQERFADGPVLALNQTPMARRGAGNVPAWVKDEQPDPAT
ncbi:hypothetical protein ACWCRD_02580 [Streptomyces sp. NPDC002092]